MPLRRSFTVTVLVGMLTFIACKRMESNYCPTATHHNCMELDAAVGNSCGNNQECSGATPVCDVGSNTCVQCTASEASACTGTTPVCGSSNTCVQCTPSEASACTGTTPVCGSSNTCIQCTVSEAGACTGTTPVCDSNNTCVQCTPSEANACTGITPVCGASNTCQGCTTHAECTASNACLADGSCAAETDVAYVAPSGTGNTCTKMTPCKTVADALNTSRSYVKFRGAGSTNELVMLNNRNVTILADPGAVLTNTSNGILLRIDGTSQVAIYDLEISGASGPNNPGISLQPGNAATVSLTRVKVSGNQGPGIAATGGSLTVTQSTVSGNQGTGISAVDGSLTVAGSTIGVSAANTGGGISITSSEYQLFNNVIANNGGPTSAFGAAQISQISMNGTHVFDFNTVTGNQAVGTNVAGVVCSLVGVPLTFTNSIVFRNGTAAQVDGANCTWSYSDVGPSAVPGIGNINADPMFVNAGQNNFHLMPGSPAQHAADPSAVLTGLASHDIDGDLRVSPADIGADQLK